MRERIRHLPLLFVAGSLDLRPPLGHLRGSQAEFGPQEQEVIGCPEARMGEEA